ncbi:MAG TPA: aldo/keto reductase [Phycisphaerae bacterium]|nr:aldo/keto reductase [Phycisphaerae bacterium]
MKYVPLGPTGVRVSRLCLGTMNFMNQAQNEHEATRIVHAAIDAGINFIDTADCYGEAELILANALKHKRDKVVLATKCWVSGGIPPNVRISSRYYVIPAVERALKRLATDHIDLMIIHRPDQVWPPAPVEETLSALTDCVRQGKIRYIGTSCYHPWRIVESQWASRHCGYERFCCEQLNYSIMNRYVERDVLGICEKYAVGVTVFSALNYGWLAGKYRRGMAPPADSRAARKFKIRIDSPDAERNFDIIEKLIPLAEQRGLPLSQFSLAWVLRNPIVTSVIIGPRLTGQLEDNLKSIDVQLDDEAMKAVDEIAPPGSGDDREYPSIMKAKSQL